MTLAVIKIRIEARVFFIKNTYFFSGLVNFQ